MKFLGQTLLGSITPEQEAAMERERLERQRAFDRWQFVAVEGWLAAYQAGCLPLENLVRVVHESISVLPDGMGAIAFGGRERLLGHVVRRALEEPVAPRQGGRPPWPDQFRAAARELVALVAEREGLVVNREAGRRGGRTAFERVAELYAKAGVRGVKADTVRDWYGKT